MISWKSKRTQLAAAMIGSLATYLATTGDIPERPPDDLAVSLKGKTAQERVLAKNFERENAMPGEEITTLRTARSKTMKTDSGRVTTVLSQKPRHWYDPQDSVWRDIDLTVQEVSALAKLNPLRKIDRYVQAGLYSAGWKDDRPHDYVFIKDDMEVSYTALFDTSETLRVTTEAKPDGMKQTITVKDKTASKTVLAWLIKTTADSVRLERGQVEYYLDGKRAARVKRPVVWDAERRSLFAYYTLSGDTLRLMVDYPSKVTYPVTIDPTTTVINDTDAISGIIYATSGSAWTARDSSAATTADADQIGAWFYDGVGAFPSVSRSIFRFDTSGLPDDAIVTAASFKAVVSDTSYKYSDFYLKLIAPQDSLSTAHFNTSMFNEFKGWSSGGVAYTPTIWSDSVSTAAKAPADTLTWTLNTDGQAGIKLSGVTQFFLVSGADMGRNPAPVADTPQLLFFEDDTPYLSVTYVLTPNPPWPSITAVSDASISLTIGANGNGSEVEYSIKITHPGGHQNYWNGSDTTATETFKTLADWGAMPEVINNRLTTNGEYWLDTRAKAAGAAVYSASNRLGARAWDKRLRNTIVAVDSSGTNSNAAVGQYLKSRAALSPDSIGVTGMSVGQNTGFSVFRSHYDFKTLYSAVDIAACSLYVYISADHSDTDFDVRLYKNNWTRNLAADYRHTKFDGWQPGELLYAGTEYATAVNTSGISDPFIMVMNASGLSYYNSKRATADTTRWSLISAEDCGASEPAGAEYLEISNIALHIGRDSTEVGLASFSLDPTSATEITATWTNGLGSNVAVLIVNAYTDAAVSDTLDFNDTSQGLTGLSVNTCYPLRAKIIGGVSDGTYSNIDSCYTWPNVPSAPTVSSPANDSLKVVINVNSNPAATKFLNFVVTSVPETLVVNRYRNILQTFTPFFVNADSLNPSIANNDSLWATYTNHGGATGKTVPVDPGKTYTVKTLAKSGI